MDLTLATRISPSISGGVSVSTVVVDDEREGGKTLGVRRGMILVGRDLAAVAGRFLAVAERDLFNVGGSAATKVLDAVDGGALTIVR